MPAMSTHLVIRGAILSVGLAVYGAGCSPVLRAVPGPSQAGVEKNRGVFEFREGIGLSAVSVGEPPVSARREFIAFGIELHNRTSAITDIDVSRMRLGLGVDAEWIERAPALPEGLLQAYRTADAGARGRFVEVTPPETARGRCYSGPAYCYPYPYYRSYYFYDYSYYDAARDAYLRQQERASFLARLLRTQAVAPSQVAGGYVVFPQPVAKRDKFRLLVPIVVRPATSQPVTTPVLAQLQTFEFHFTAK